MLADDIGSGRSPVLVLDGAVRRFGDVTAVDRLTLHVGRGEVVGLLGHNGAGKTTTVRLLAGLIATDDGQVRVAGLDPVADGVETRRLLGVLPARPVVDDRLTAVANLRFVAEVHGLTRDGLDARIAAVLDAFELADRADERVEGFSTGMRHRLSLARVLLPEPSILLLDEPTAALDPVATRQVRRVLGDLARASGRTIVLCTHDLAEAELLCDRVVVLEHGRVVADGSPAELAAAHGTGGLQVEVDVAHVAQARRVLASHAPGDVEVDAGGRIRTVGIARATVPHVVERLVEAGVTIYEVRRLEPTLEDVYLALHREARTSASGGAA